MLDPRSGNLCGAIQRRPGFELWERRWSRAATRRLVVEQREVPVMPSGPEWFIVLAIVLIFFGGSQLPKLARNLGQAQKEFKEGIGEAHGEAAPTRAD
jgi:sec-independent protein translocase protein TatA